MAPRTPDDEELARLRARAYGRGADIHADPDALQRLSELENREPVMPAVKPDTNQASHEDPVIDPPQVEVNPVPSSQPRKRPRPSGRALAGIWAVSVVLAAVVGGCIGGAVGEHDPAVVAVLSEAPELEVPSNLTELTGSEASDLIRFQDYLGVIIVGYSTPGSGEDPQSCIGITNESVKVARGGCLPHGLDAMAVMEVTTDYPAALRDRHPPGTFLLFTHVGDHIEVRVSD